MAANPGADVIALVRQGWAAVRAEGCSSPAYAEGVASASRILSILSRELEVDAVTTDALAACGNPALLPVRAQIEIRHAQELARRRDLVKAVKFMKASVAREEAAGADSATLLSLRSMLASIDDQEGDWKEAERILQQALAGGKPDQRIWPKDNFVSMRSALPFFGEPYQLLAALYARHERIAEAEQIYRDHAASAQGTAQEHVIALRELAQFLATHGSNEEAVKVQRQLLQEETSQPGQPNNGAGDEANLANYEIKAGQKEEGMRLLQSEVDRAAGTKGVNSWEYQWARSNLFQNALQAGEFELAEKLAREDLERAQGTRDKEAGQLMSAMGNLAYVLRTKGDTAAAGELDKQISELSLNRMSGRWGDLQRSFAAVEKLIQEGNAAPALVQLENIATAYAPFRTDELRQFLLAAHSLLGSQHKPEAIRAAELTVAQADKQGLADDPRSMSLYAEWANFYGGHLGDAATADKLLQKLEILIRECCGEQSPRMELVLRERLALTREREDRIAALEKLRDFEARVFGANSQDTENTTMMLAQTYMGAGDWGMVQEMYGKALEMSSERDGTKTSQHVNLMGRVAMDLSNYGRYQAALEINEQALKLCEGVLYADRIRPNLERVRQQIEERMAQRAGRR